VSAELSAAVPVAAVGAPPAPRDALGPLTRRASLNAAGSLVDYGARIAVGFLVTPILLTGLGRSLFGIWEMLNRAGGYLTAADGRPTEALRLVIAQRQGDPDDRRKRRYVGAALAVWVLMLPLLAAAGGLFIWLGPRLTGAGPALRWDVQLTCALLVANLLFSTLTAVPESVLRGMNLGYKRMGLQAALNVAGGVLLALAVLAERGLPGLGAATAARTAAAGICFWLLARNFVAWFGVARPALRDVRGLFGMSVWLAAGDLVAKIGLASDVVILGAVVAPAAVTTFVLTGYAPRIAVSIHALAAGAAIPGLGGVLGLRQPERAALARRELMLLTWLFTTVAGGTLLLWNPALLSLWVGAENYAGGWVGLLIVLIALQTAFIRIDAYVIDAALKPRLRVLVGAGAAVLTVGLGIPLTRAFGMPGLCVAVLASRAIQSIGYPLLARASLGTARPAGHGGTARLVVVTTLVLAAAALIGPRIAVAHWGWWLAGVGATVPALTAACVAGGPSSEGRRALLRRWRVLLRSGRGR
jgi:O-antigen/teichoic acid export membrane protein